MKQLLLASALCLALSLAAFAQENDAMPASRADVQTYFEAVRSHEQVEKMMDAMLQPMHQMIHDQFDKDRDKLPADFEERETKILDGMIKNMPMDDMIQAMIPAYENNFTHGDIIAMNEFYSSPVGQKALRLTPTVTQEGMQEMMPILSKYLTRWQEKVDAEFKDTGKTPPKPSEPAAQN